MRGCRRGSLKRLNLMARLAAQTKRRVPRESQSRQSCNASVSGVDVWRASKRQQDDKREIGKPLLCWSLPTLSKAQGVCWSSGRRASKRSKISRRVSNFHNAGCSGSFQGSVMGKHSTLQFFQLTILPFAGINGPNPPVTILVALSSLAIWGNSVFKKPLLQREMGGWSSSMRYTCFIPRDCKSAHAERTTHIQSRGSSRKGKSASAVPQTYIFGWSGQNLEIWPHVHFAKAAYLGAVGMRIAGIWFEEKNLELLNLFKTFISMLPTALLWKMELIEGPNFLAYHPTYGFDRARWLLQLKAAWSWKSAIHNFKTI